MASKFLLRLCLSSALLALLLIGTNEQQVEAKDNRQQSNGPNTQPLTNLDKVLQQANGLKVDSLMSPKLASNVTNALNDMAANLRKMLVENKRLSNQLQEVMQRMQNATGINATNTVGNLQQQASNLTGLTNLANLNNLNSLISGFQVPSIQT